jgi:D-citramalate synthase
MKGDLYASRLLPDRFRRKRRYALGKLSGKASVDHNLKRLGIELSPAEKKLLLQRIIELGDKKHTVGTQDLPLIIADLLKQPEESRIRVEHYDVNVSSTELPRAQVTVAFRGKTAKAEANGDGGYDAFMNALRKAMKDAYDLELPRLLDFRVRIAPGGRTTALVETIIRWDNPAEDDDYVTIGVDSDQMAAAVIATEKMLNSIVPAPSKSAKSKRKQKSNS